MARRFKICSCVNVMINLEPVSDTNRRATFSGNGRESLEFVFSFVVELTQSACGDHFPPRLTVKFGRKSTTC